MLEILLQVEILLKKKILSGSFSSIIIISFCFSSWKSGKFDKSIIYMINNNISTNHSGHIR